MDTTQLYRDCVNEIESILKLLDLNSQQARERLMDMKAKWIFLLTTHRGTEIERRLEEAVTRLPRANTAPSSWHDQLSEAKSDFEGVLTHKALEQKVGGGGGS